MSYDITLADENGACQIARHEEGGTYRLGGTTEAHLNCTYNYAPFYYAHLDTEKGIRWLYGKTGAECVPRLEAAIAAIAVDTDLAATQRASVEEGRRKARAWLDENPDRADHPLASIYRNAASAVDDYWTPTPENANRALVILLGWARQHPCATFDGD